MKQLSTNQELVDILADVQKQGPAFLLFNRSKIQAFNKENAIRIAMLRQRSKALADQYGAKDEKGEVIIDAQTNSITFATPEDQDNFSIEWAHFMEQNIELNI